MAVPEDVIWDLEPHTEAKHRVLAGYYDALYPILTHKFPRLTLFEGYAGPGVYRGGEPGSPIIAIQKLLDHPTAAHRRVQFIFVEERSDRLGRLRVEVSSHFPKLPPETTVDFRLGTCEEEWEQALNQTGAWGMPIFANLDPFGPGVPYALVERLAKNVSSEPLITFPSDWLRRFATLTDIPAGDVQFGSTQWRTVAQLDGPEEKEMFLVEEYRRTLARAGFTHTAPFKLSDEGGRSFYLIFGTGHRRGLERMKDSMWKTDLVQGLSFRDPRDPNQGVLDFGSPTPDLSPLVSIVTAQLQTAGVSGMTVEELKDFAVLNTGFRGPHVTTALTTMLTQKVITRDPIKGRLTSQIRIRLCQPEYASASRPTSWSRASDLPS